MYNVYNQHKGQMVSFPPEHSIEDVKRLADAYARLGHDAFLRVFKVEDTPSGQRFETAFSVLNGKVTEHKDVTIPLAHF